MDYRWMNHRTALNALLSLVLTVALLALPSIPIQAASKLLSATDPAIIARSLVSAGNTARIQRALAKARRGEPIVIGTIGGSITAGYMASQAQFNYPNRVTQWWRDRFPAASVTLVNAGIGATCSDLGAHRVKSDLLSANPDLVIVEFTVNDYTFPLNQETMEGLVRQILAQPNFPGLIMLFTMLSDGSNQQSWHVPVGAHYNLPMISYRDALWPEIQAGRLAWTDISPDTVHPNDRGHQYIAEFVGAFLDQVLAALPADKDLPPVPDLPTPLVSDVFAHTAFWKAANIHPAENHGWSIGPDLAPFGNCLQASTPGSTIAFDFQGTAASLLFYSVHGDMGIVRARVDSEPAVLLDAYYDPTWGGWNTCKLIAQNLPYGPHRLNIELLSDTNALSHGHLFQINAIMAAGIEPEKPVSVELQFFSVD